jgi:N-acetylglucosaminyl-diphospho-decaprenol L-rhamnosyltransferase
MPRYWFESRRRFLRKHHGQLYLQTANVVWVVGFSLWRVRRRLQRKPEEDKPRMLADFIRFSFARGKAST